MQISINLCFVNYFPGMWLKMTSNMTDLAQKELGLETHRGKAERKKT